MVESDKDLEATYGPAAPFSEHKRGDHITYLSTRLGKPRSGTILWVDAAFEGIPLEYLVAPDSPEGDFPEYVYPSEVIQEAGE